MSQSLVSAGRTIAPVSVLEKLSHQKRLRAAHTGAWHEVRSRWTLTHLYLLFTCPYDKLNVKPEPVTLAETNKLWEWDVAEVFVGSISKTSGDTRNLKSRRKVNGLTWT